MLSKKQYDEVKENALAIYEKAHVILTQQEKDNLEVADFGLNDVYHTGLAIVTYVNTERCCAKELVLLPGQTCPEHRHAPIPEKNYMGKEETFRCRFGEVYLYVEGEAAENPAVRPPRGVYTAFREIRLLPGEQYTLYPNTRHWFQAGRDGAVVSEFSTSSYDECDIFTDPAIQRIPVVEA